MHLYNILLTTIQAANHLESDISSEWKYGIKINAVLSRQQSTINCTNLSQMVWKLPLHKCYQAYIRQGHQSIYQSHATHHKPHYHLYQSSTEIAIINKSFCSILVHLFVEEHLCQSSG